MTSGLSGRQFGWRVGWRVALFIVLVFGLPLVVFVVNHLNGDDEETLREVMRLTTGTPIALLAYLLFVLSMIWPCWRRMRALGWPRIGGLIVPALMLIEWPFFYSSRETQIFGPAIGSPGGIFPLSLATATVLVVAMIIAERRPPDLRPADRLREMALVLLLIVAFCSPGYFFGMAHWADTVRIADANGEDFSGWFVPMMLAMPWVQWLNVFACIAVAFLALSIAGRSRTTSTSSIDRD